MIREYCDKCGKEIPESKFVALPGETHKSWTVTRYEVKVTRGPDRNHGPNPDKAENFFEFTTDVLCPDCVKDFRIAPETRQ